MAACDRFIYLDLLGSESAPETDDPTSEEAPLPNLQSLLTKAINSASQDDGTVSVSGLGNYLRLVSTSFDPRLYGHPKLSALVQAQPFLTVTGSGSAMQVSLKSRTPARKTAKKAAKKATST